MKGRVDPLFTFYKGNLRLIRTINLHGESVFWNLPRPHRFSVQLSCSQLYALLSSPFVSKGSELLLLTLQTEKYTKE